MKPNFQILTSMMVASFLFIGEHVLGQESKTAVRFTCECNDSTAAPIASSVRDLIAVSPRYISAKDFQYENGEHVVFNWGLRVVSLEYAHDATVLSYVVTWGPVYQTHGVMTCGTNRVRDCAEDLIAALDKQVSR